MSTKLYSNSEADASPNFSDKNNITIAWAQKGKYLTKRIYQNKEIPYDQAYLYRFFCRDVYCLSDLLQLTVLCLSKPQCCFIRGVPKDDNDRAIQRRTFHDKPDVEATIIEQKQNWYALDIDGYGECSGDLKRDTKTVLLALGLQNVEAFSIPSAGYLRKTGIRIRLFLWNNVKVSCISLKKHFEKYKSVVDLALFHPIQPIYVARPIFHYGDDPCSRMFVWIPGEVQCTDIPERYNKWLNDRSEELYTRKQARRYLNTFLQESHEIASGDRHKWLIKISIALGKWIRQDLLDEGDVIDELFLTTAIWGGDRKRDMQTILDGIKEGKLKMENEYE